MEDRKYKSVAIVGRVFGDDEDTCLVFEDVTVSEARVKFANEMFSEYGAEADAIRDQNMAEFKGLGIYITHTLLSDSKIEIE